MKNNLKELNVSELETINGGWVRWLVSGVLGATGALVEYQTKHPNDKVHKDMLNHLTHASANRLT